MTKHKRKKRKTRAQRERHQKRLTEQAALSESEREQHQREREYKRADVRALRLSVLVEEDSFRYERETLGVKTWNFLGLRLNFFELYSSSGSNGSPLQEAEHQISIVEKHIRKSPPKYFILDVSGEKNGTYLMFKSRLSHLVNTPRGIKFLLAHYSDYNQQRSSGW